MPDTKITALAAITTVAPSNDLFPIVDVSDNSMAASGTTKNITVNQLLGAGGIAALSSATITGDLTVRTNKLKVTSIGVGAGTTTPAAILHSTQTTSYDALILDSDSASTYCTANWKVGGVQKAQAFLDVADDSLLIRTNTATGPLKFGCNNIIQHRIDPLGVFNWYDGAGGTRMTLNATGLGVGAVPSFEKLVLQSASDCIVSLKKTGGLDAFYVKTDGTTGWLGSSAGSTGNKIGFNLKCPDSSLLLDISGNVGIGVTPSAWDSGFQVIENSGGSLWSGSTGAVRLSQNAYYATGLKYKNALAASQYVQTSGQHQWFTASSGTAGTTITDFATAKMTLDASGNLLVGTTASGGQNGFCVLRPLSSGVVATTTETAHNFGALTGTTYATFLYATTAIGSITQNGTTGVLYNINSDYRLKESVAPLSGGLARVNALKPSIYKWKSDGSSGEGFLAHELAEVVPFAVTGEKDAVNEDGSIKSQGIDMSRVVPILVAAIQELTARVQTLETR